VVYDKTDAYTGMTTAARVRVSLGPREVVQIDGTDNDSVKSLNLQCGKNAEKLTIVDTDSVALGITNQQPSQPLKASTSGF
jgi:molybdopterin-binding protein